MKDKSFEKQLWEQIEMHIPNISKREARFRKVDKIPSLGAFMKALEKECKDCQNYRQELEQTLANLPFLLKEKPTILEKKMDSWTLHLQKNHEIYPQFYFNYRWGAGSFFAGLFLGIVLSFLVKFEFDFQIISLITCFFLLAGSLYGNHLDVKIKNKGKNF